MLKVTVNEEDTHIGNIKDLSASLPVNVVVTQYSGETLEEYV